MSDFVYDFLAGAEADDLRNVVADLRAENDELRQAIVRLSRLDEVLSDFGDQWAGRFIATDGDAFPDEASFSGMFMSAELQDIYDGNRARLAEVLNGVAQFWVADGAAWAGGGNVKMYAGGHRIANAVASGAPHDMIKSVKIIWGDMAEALGAPDVQVYGYGTSDSFTDRQHFRIEVNHYYGSGTLAATTGMEFSQLDDTGWPGSIYLFTNGGAAVSLSDGAIPYVIVNPNGINADFYVRGQSDANTLYVDASANHVGIGLSAPAAKLHVKPVTNEIVSIFQGYTGQTNDLTEWQDVSGNVLTRVSSAGYIGIGVSPLTSLEISRAYTSSSSGRASMVANYTGTVTSGSGVSLYTAIALNFTMTTAGAVAFPGYTIGVRGTVLAAVGVAYGTVLGISGLASVTSASASISIFMAIQAALQWQALGAVTTAKLIDLSTSGNVKATTLYGAYIKTGSLYAVTTAYGIYLEDVTGATTNYAILTNAGQVVFNEGGDAGADLRWESDTEPYMLWGDASADAIYLGGSTDAVKVTKSGEMTFTGMASIKWQTNTANSVTLSAGTSTSTVSDLQSKNNVYYHVDEAAATPGINLVVEFTGITNFNWVQILGQYDGSHAVLVQVYRWTSTSYVTFDTMSNEAGQSNHDFFIPDSTNFIGTGADAGKVRVRFYHSAAGNAAHNLDIDCVFVNQ